MLMDGEGIGEAYHWSRKNGMPVDNQEEMLRRYEAYKAERMRNRIKLAQPIRSFEGKAERDLHCCIESCPSFVECGEEALEWVLAQVMTKEFDIWQPNNLVFCSDECFLNWLSEEANERPGVLVYGVC